MRKVSNLIEYLVFDNLSKYPEIVHCVSTRYGGMSQEPFASLNLSLSVGDEREAVIANRRLLCQALDVSYASLVVTRQLHGNKVAVIGDRIGFEQPEEWYRLLSDFDGLVTDVPGRTVLMTFADCVPILFYDPIHKAIGLAHAGWRGTVGRVAQRTVAAMEHAFASDPAELIAAIGPSIGPCCYEVGEEVIAAIKDGFTDADDLLVRSVSGSLHLDLWETNRRQLVEAGIPAEHIEVTSLCTSCHTELFFSHRAESGKTGRFAAVIGLVPSPSGRGLG